MKFIADTNLVSELTKALPSPSVRRWVSDNGDDVGLSWVSVAELRAGIQSMPPGKKRDTLHEDIEGLIADFYDDDLLRLTGATAVRYAELVARRKHAGMQIHFADTVIAALALELGMTVATRNTKDFPGVPTVNPWDEDAPGGEEGGRKQKGPPSVDGSP